MKAHSLKPAPGVGIEFTLRAPRRRPSRVKANVNWSHTIVQTVGDRELGLAYAGLAGFQAQAIQYLERAQPRDAPVLSQLTLLYDRSGQEEKAIPLDEEALKVAQYRAGDLKSA